MFSWSITWTVCMKNKIERNSTTGFELFQSTDHPYYFALVMRFSGKPNTHDVFFWRRDVASHVWLVERKTMVIWKCRNGRGKFGLSWNSAARLVKWSAFLTYFNMRQNNSNNTYNSRKSGTTLLEFPNLKYLRDILNL